MKRSDAEEVVDHVLLVVVLVDVLVDAVEVVERHHADHVELHDLVAPHELGVCLAEAHHGLQLPDPYLLAVPHLHVVLLNERVSLGSHPRLVVLPGVVEVLLQLVAAVGALGVLPDLLPDELAEYLHGVRLVLDVVGLVDHHEDQVEPVQQGRDEPAVLLERHAAHVLLPGASGVAGSHQAHPCVQLHRYPRLLGAYRLLLQDLQDRLQLLLLQQVELVDAADALVREHQRPRLHHPLAPFPDVRHRQPRLTRPDPVRVHAPRTHLTYESQQT